MIWQDIVLMLGGACFAVALIPSVFSKSKPAAATSFITAVVLVAFCVAYATLELWAGFSTTAITAVLWMVLLGQKVIRR